MKNLIQIASLLNLCRYTLLLVLLSAAQVFISHNALAGADEKKLMMLKAVMVIKFFKYTDWPENNKESNELPNKDSNEQSDELSKPASKEKSFNLCVLNSPRLFSTFKRIEGKKIRGKPLSIKQVSTNDISQNLCHMLYMGEFDQALLSKIEKIKQPILTISDQSGFAAAGGMIELTTRKTRLSFNINLSHLNNEKLKLNSAVLELAKQVFK